MSLFSEARTQSFNALLTMRGVSLNYNPGNFDFMALMQLKSPDNEKFEISNERVSDKISILRSDLAAVGLSPALGTSFALQDGSYSYRITKVEDNPLNVAVVFDVETTKVSQ